MNIEFLEIGRRIKTIRTNANLEQTDFGELFGVGNQTVSNWETGKKKIDVEYLIRIASFGNVSLDWLLLGVDSSSELKKELEQKDFVIRELLTKYGELSHSVSKDISDSKAKRMD